MIHILVLESLVLFHNIILLLQIVRSLTLCFSVRIGAGSHLDASSVAVYCGGWISALVTNDNGLIKKKGEHESGSFNIKTRFNSAEVNYPS
jgi:hypothetical protein